MTATAQTELLCHNCGGQGAFDPAQGGLLCQSCGTLRTLETDQDATAQVETAYDPEAPCTEKTLTGDTQAHQCQTCGGEVLFTGPALSEHCPYCDGPVVLRREEAAYETMALIPFEIPQAEALARAQAWVRRRIAAPSDLPQTVSTARVAGLYAPFWTFDSREAVAYWAKRSTGSGKNRRTVSLKGKMRIDFDDLVVPASPHVTPLIRDGILHDFQPGRLRPYRAGYLAGFAAERHHQTIAEGLTANEADKRLLIRNRIKRHIGKSGVHSIRYNTDTSGIHYRRILLPVWMMHYVYAGRAYKVVVCGIQGRTFGERPFSPVKLALLAGLGTAVAMGIGLAWGALAAM